MSYTWDQWLEEFDWAVKVGASPYQPWNLPGIWGHYSGKVLEEAGETFNQGAADFGKGVSKASGLLVVGGIAAIAAIYVLGRRK